MLLVTLKTGSILCQQSNFFYYSKRQNFPNDNSKSVLKSPATLSYPCWLSDIHTSIIDEAAATVSTEGSILKVQPSTVLDTSKQWVYRKSVRVWGSDWCHLKASQISCKDWNWKCAELMMLDLTNGFVLAIDWHNVQLLWGWFSFLTNISLCLLIL